MKQSRLFSGITFVLFPLLLFFLFLSVSQASEDACVHQWVLVDTVPATCDTEGYELFRCALCGEETRETLAALGHLWSYCTMVKKTTCTEEGLLRCYCARDQSHYYDTIEPALGHNWGEWHITKRETLNEWGASERQCDRCGEIEKRWIRPMAYRERYGLTLILSPKSTDVKPQDDSSVVLVQEISLINTGETDLIIQEYSIKEAITKELAEPIHLLSGQASTFLLTCMLTEDELSRIVASNAANERIPLTLCFYGSTDAEAKICASNSVPWEPLLLRNSSAELSSTRSPLRVVQTILSSSAEKRGYQLSETLRCLICVTNESDVPSPEACLKTDSETDPLLVPSLSPGESKSLTWSHEITLAEAIAGYSYVTWHASWVEDTGSIPPPESSNSIVVPVISALDLLLEVWPEYDPTNEASFEAGDEICLRLRLKNNCAYPLSGITVSTPFFAVDSGEPAAFLEQLKSEEECIIELRYCVTEQDVQAGAIRFSASAQGVDPRGIAHECGCGEISIPITLESPVEGIRLRD